MHGSGAKHDDTNPERAGGFPAVSVLCHQLSRRDQINPLPSRISIKAFLIDNLLCGLTEFFWLMGGRLVVLCELYDDYGGGGERGVSVLPRHHMSGIRLHIRCEFACIAVICMHFYRHGGAWQ